MKFRLGDTMFSPSQRLAGAPMRRPLNLKSPKQRTPRSSLHGSSTSKGNAIFPTDSETEKKSSAV